MRVARHTLILTLLVGVVVPPAAHGQARNRPDTVGELTEALQNTARRASPAVVEIFATSYAPAQGLIPRDADLITTDRASGSGVIVDQSGYIVTNAHVVRGARHVRVEVPGGAEGQSILPPQRRSLTATIVGLDAETDVAVLKVDATALPALSFGDSDTLRAGQLVLAIGNPLGLSSTVSLGIISTVARQLEPDSPMVYVQTDAPIASGSSGGPLVDLQGRIVGINTLVGSQSGAYEGIGFAAPINIVRSVYEQIRKAGRVRRGDIGVRAQTVTPLLAAGLGLAREQGVVIADVRPGGMADRAGVRVGDLVLALDGKPMENGRQLQVGLYRRFVGDVVTLEILREGATQTIPVAVAERDDPLVTVSAAADPREHLVARLGIVGVDLTRQIVPMLPQLRVRSGVVVVSARPGTVDARDGELVSGDVIYAVNRKPVGSVAELRLLLDAFTPGSPAVLHVDRNGELMFLSFTVE